MSNIKEARTKRTLTLPFMLDEKLRLEAARQRIPVGRLAERAIALFLNAKTEPETEQSEPEVA